LILISQPVKLLLHWIPFATPLSDEGYAQMRPIRRSVSLPPLKLARGLLLLSSLPLLALPLVSCAPDNRADELFTALANRYLDSMLELNPVWATNLGDHRFDATWPDLSRAGIENRIAFNRAYLDTLDTVGQRGLNEVNRIDYQILRDRIESTLFSLEELREWEWNPLIYNPGDGIYNLIAREFAPLGERLESVKARLEAIPSLVAAAKANLQNPPYIFTETAIQQNPGAISLVMDGLQPYLEQEPQLIDEFVGVRARAIAALQDYGTWLEEKLVPRSNGDFRLGGELFRKKLRFSLASDLSPQRILAMAEQELAITRQQMYDIALPLYEAMEHEAADRPAQSSTLSPQVVIGTVLAKLAEDRPDNESIVPQAQRDLELITEFVRDHDLVTVPDDPVKLIVMPEHQRGLYIGYCDSPGPLEENGETFYAISPTPRDWTPERAESFYKEYNDYMLRNLTIHEAMPGHYLQLAHANRFEAPTKLRAIFGSGTFVEGWATYAEQLMVEAGYGGPELHLQQLKMRLRLIINSIIDQKIHTAGMTEEQAVEMMMVDGFQEEGEAAGKWRRACLTSTQLSTYFVGNLEINAIRHDHEAEAGDGFELKKFHDRLLSFGSPAPRYARQLLGLPAVASR